jgi:hypothetical protein
MIASTCGAEPEWARAGRQAAPRVSEHAAPAWWYGCVMHACRSYAVVLSLAHGACVPTAPAAPTATGIGTTMSTSPPTPTSPASVPRVCHGDVAMDMCGAGEICVEHQGGAPYPHNGKCMKLPDACHGTPSCDCIERSVCGPNDRCSMDGPHYVTCTCIDCP